MHCFTSILFHKWETGAQKGIGPGLRCSTVVGLKNNTIRIDQGFLLMLLWCCSIKEGMNYSPLPKASTERYCLLFLAFSAAPRNRGISQHQHGDQKVVVGAKKSLNLQREGHTGAPSQEYFMISQIIPVSW